MLSTTNRDSARLVLAPMAGVTDRPYRAICTRWGADETVTEMISAQGLIYSGKRRLAYDLLTDTDAIEKKVSAQLFGRDPGFMRKAAALLTETGRFWALDINMGCPAHKIVGGGGGSALMREPALARQIMRAVKEGTDLPVSLKIRLGWDADDINAVEIALIAQDEGIAWLTVHGRTRMQQYAGKADWEQIAQVKAAVTIPVIANGDVFTPYDALKLLDVTGADGVAIGRGALGNPFIFAQTRALLNGDPMPAVSGDEIFETARGHLETMLAHKGERFGLLDMRKHLAWYLKGVNGAAKARARINVADDPQQVLDILAELLLRSPGDDILSKEEETPGS